MHSQVTEEAGCQQEHHEVDDADLADTVRQVKDSDSHGTGQESQDGSSHGASVHLPEGSLEAGPFGEGCLYFFLGDEGVGEVV